MKADCTALCVLIVGLHTAMPALADIRPEQAGTALAAIEDAKTLANASRGQLLLVGSTLATEHMPSDNLVVVLDDPIVRDMQPGMILILARNGCEPLAACLIARLVTGIDIDGELQTAPYTSEGWLSARVKATLLGSVSYAIDLETASIRDMHAGRAPQLVTLARAVAEARARSVATTDGEDR